MNVDKNSSKDAAPQPPATPVTDYNLYTATMPSASSAPEAGELEIFETWATGTGLRTKIGDPRRGSFRYFDDATNRAWEGWSARAAIASPPALPKEAGKIDEAMVELALAAEAAYWADDSHATKCKPCNGTGVVSIGDEGQDLCHLCGGNGMFHDGTEEGAMRAALETAGLAGGKGDGRDWQLTLTLPGELPPLHPATQELIANFCVALAKKAAAAEAKYGYTDGWRSPDWMDECRAKMLHHIGKGDPRDVAIYCAFLWHHGASTAHPESATCEASDYSGNPCRLPAGHAGVHSRARPESAARLFTNAASATERLWDGVPPGTAEKLHEYLDAKPESAARKEAGNRQQEPFGYVVRRDGMGDVEFYFTKPSQLFIPNGSIVTAVYDHPSPAQSEGAASTSGEGHE